MKRILIALALVLVVVLAGVPASPTKAAPVATITVLNLPPSGVLELGIGESYTFDVLITSDQPFVLAMVLPNAYYPGRGVFWHDSDRATQSTSALLHVTITGKNPTADLPAVSDWPEPGINWPGGVVPVLIAAGVRYQGGQVISEEFPLAVWVH